MLLVVQQAGARPAPTRQRLDADHGGGVAHQLAIGP
jgi:hypothetical protein